MYILEVLVYDRSRTANCLAQLREGIRVTQDWLLLSQVVYRSEKNYSIPRNINYSKPALLKLVLIHMLFPSNFLCSKQDL
jgi:hypothetical protein